MSCFVGHRVEKLHISTQKSFCIPSVIIQEHINFPKYSREMSDIFFALFSCPSYQKLKPIIWGGGVNILEGWGENKDCPQKYILPPLSGQQGSYLLEFSCTQQYRLYCTQYNNNPTIHSINLYSVKNINPRVHNIYLYSVQQ